MKLDLKKSVDTVFQLADIIDEYNVGIQRIYKDTGCLLHTAAACLKISCTEAGSYSCMQEKKK